MEILPLKIFGEADGIKMHGLIEPDEIGPYAVRYLWIQHRYENDKFFDNYFSEGNQTGLNVRKQTSHLKSDWDYHNRIFFESAENGNLAWRVKVGNKISRSIDYIEVWKSKDILINYFGMDDVQLDNTTVWKLDSKKQFGEHLYNAGFKIRHWVPYPLMSKKMAADYYYKFLDMYRSKDMCIINTQWNREINPL